ncbi:pyridoxamine 5'-phosphate oxidase family protein [Streptomyces sp. PLK6-54]|uniref:Pyridoxamine 5'-phosphate oxidase family protein n=2 Tax=Actinacidiphila acidipaludis TaxID=2873382 RepID=A0ABS7Q884_9ACTN|nr:pyridoxamine 5'-phosphate oxidase family protein [Streptomyces acidipaludis]
MLAPPDLTGVPAFFLAQRDLAVLTAADGDGLLWTVPLTGHPGFLHVVDETTVDVLTLPAPGGPLATGPARGSAVGMIAVDFALRRRFRVNGTVVATGPTGFAVRAQQAFGNCPQYIQRRDVEADPAPHAGAPGPRDAAGAAWREEPDADDVRLISGADTFFLGTVHPGSGADASHRGGAPGFVRVEDGGLWWPDYPGNNMFASLGNIDADPRAALLFPDFASGTMLQLSGRAAVEWTEPGGGGDDGVTGRRVRFTPERVVRTPAAFRAGPVTPSPRNPRLAG